MFDYTHLITQCTLLHFLLNFFKGIEVINNFTKHILQIVFHFLKTINIFLICIFLDETSQLLFIENHFTNLIQLLEEYGIQTRV